MGLYEMRQKHLQGFFTTISIVNNELSDSPD